MKRLAIISLLLITVVSYGQNRRGVYNKLSCFCDSHSNSQGWYLGFGGYGSQFSMSNGSVDGKLIGYGGGGFLGNKITEQLAFQVGFYTGVTPKVDADKSNDGSAVYEQYSFKHNFIPISLLYKFKTEKRLSPYLTIGGEVNMTKQGIGYTAMDPNTEVIIDENQMNQVNINLGAGTFVIFGEHLGMFLQATLDANPFVNDHFSHYSFALTGKAGFTYHF